MSNVETFRDLYQASKEKRKNIEMNFTDLDGKNDITNLDVSDFFVDSSEKFDFLTGDGFIPIDCALLLFVVLSC